MKVFKLLEMNKAGIATCSFHFHLPFFACLLRNKNKKTVIGRTSALCPMYLFTHPTVTPTSAQTTAVNSQEMLRITFHVSEGASQKAFFKKKLKRKFQCLWHSFYNLQDKFMTLTEFLRQCKKKMGHWRRLPPASYTASVRHQSIVWQTNKQPCN